MKHPRTVGSKARTRALRRALAPLELVLSILLVVITGCSSEVGGDGPVATPFPIAGSGGSSAGASSSGGSAGVAAPACTMPQVTCPSGCVNTQTDPANCGSCGKACAGGQSCVLGVCRSDGEDCGLGRQACGGMCVDLQTDSTHCGNCTTACMGGRVCASGSCTCATGSLLCGDACANTMTDSQHCGGCNQPCAAGKVCQAGMCACATGRQACGDTCADLQTDNANCGACDKACAGGSVCMAGQCTCPMGKALCGDTCVDLQTSGQHCGACDKTCGLGQSCMAGMCSSGGGGGLLDDGCQGLAQNLTIDQVAVYQTVKIPIVEAGMPVDGDERNADVVAGRQALFRIFVKVGTSGFTARSMSARVFVENAGVVTIYYSTEKPTISKNSVEEDLKTTFQVELPKEAITPETRFAVEIAECGGMASGGMQTPRYPASDGATLGALKTGPLKVHLVPITVNSMMPETTEMALKSYKDYLLATYPITDVTFEVGDPLSVTSVNWTGMLDNVRARRQTERPEADVYYYGLVRPRATLREYCQQSCTTGIGYVPQGQTTQQASQRAAVGIGFADRPSTETMAHELGHNHGRQHTPCGNPAQPDPNYPYARGEIGVFGYDVRQEAIVPKTRTDIMGYCQDKWFSDYTYQALVSKVRQVLGVQSVYVAPSALSKFRVLLIEAGTARWGVPIDEPSVPAGVPEEAEVFDENGQPIASITVYRTAIADMDAFSIEVPVPAAGWFAVRVDGGPLLAF